MKILQQEAVNAARIGQTPGVSGVAPNSAIPGQGTDTVASVGAATPAATVSFSPRAQEIAQAKAAVDAAPDVRESLVASLKAKVESGTYHVSGADVADMMMRRFEADRSASG